MRAEKKRENVKERRKKERFICVHKSTSRPVSLSLSHTHTDTSILSPSQTKATRDTQFRETQFL